MVAKHEEILEFIRGEIVRGVHAPGTMLPTRVDYEKQFGATAPTVQKAFDRLIADGFVHVRHRVGTFVAERPPHLNRYAVTLPYRSSENSKQSRFYEAMREAAREVNLRTGRELVFYPGLVAAGDATFARLCEDVAGRRLAGIIHLRSLDVIHDARILDPEIPSVVVGGQSLADRHGVLLLDYESVLDAGAAYLAARGCRRVAVLEDSEGLGAETLDPARERILAKHGLVLAELGYAALPTSVPNTARIWVRLLATQAEGARPDGLIVLDDNLTVDVVRGLADLGERAPRDFHVVTHNNFPTALPAGHALHVLGYDAAELLATGIAYIDQCHAGKQPERVMRFQARTYDELQAARALMGFGAANS